jgi:hypothetical protein
MSPVKAQRRPETALERRLTQVCTVLGLGYELPLIALSARADVKYSTLKNAGARDSLTYDLARKLAAVFEDAEETTIEWLRGKDGGRAPETPKRAPGSLPGGLSAPGAPEGALVAMTRLHGGSALARVLQDAMDRDEMNGSRQALKDFRRFVFTLAKDLGARHYDASAKEFMYLYEALTEELERIGPPEEGKL